MGQLFFAAFTRDPKDSEDQDQAEGRQAQAQAAKTGHGDQGHQFEGHGNREHPDAPTLGGTRERFDVERLGDRSGRTTKVLQKRIMRTLQTAAKLARTGSDGSMGAFHTVRSS
ncbi:MAG: hypothetical protein U1G07_21625 [Verrucomicrobiota bacterium]